MKERIITLLGSSDIEMVELGITLMFNQGEEWIKSNIPLFGVAFNRDGPYVLSTRVDERTLYTRGNVGCKVNGYVDVRFIKDFPSSILRNQKEI